VSLRRPTWTSTHRQSRYWEQEDEGDRTALSSMLLKPISSLSASLTFLASSLPRALLATAYKRIAGHIAGHLHQRLIYHRSKGRFTTVAGKCFKAQCDIWIQTCERAVRGGAPTSNIRRPEAGWVKLQDVAALLSIGEVEVSSVVSVAFDGAREEPYTQLCEQLGLNGSLTLDEVRDVLRARTDTRR
jgi:hypothetical protein